MDQPTKRSQAGRNTSRSVKDRYYNLFQHSPISIWEEDFSEVKRVFDRLRKKGVTDFREHFDAHPEDVLSLAQKVKIVGVNNATLKIFGAGDQRELKRGLSFIFSKASYDVFREELIAFAQGKTEFYSEAVNLTLSGDERHVLLKAVVIPGHEETLSNVVIYIIDISDLKRLEAHLRESEEKYRRIVESVHDAIVLVDTETGIILEVNKRGEELIGLPATEIVGMHFTQLHPQEETEFYRKIFQRHAKGETAVTDNLSVCHTTGNRIPVSISSSIITIRGKQCISAIYRQVPDRGASAGKPASIDKHPAHLSKREFSVLRLIASGLTAREIADKLYISEKTVVTHRARIMKKLNVHKTAHLVKYAATRGLIEENHSL